MRSWQIISTRTRKTNSHTTSSDRRRGPRAGWWAGSGPRPIGLKPVVCPAYATRIACRSKCAFARWVCCRQRRKRASARLARVPAAPPPAPPGCCCPLRCFALRCCCHGFDSWPRLLPAPTNPSSAIARASAKAARSAASVSAALFAQCLRTSSMEAERFLKSSRCDDTDACTINRPLITMHD